ncbi:hypothetical protein ACA910_006187 [Epithemia clementina (nom. ined.)]
MKFYFPVVASLTLIPQATQAWSCGSPRSYYGGLEDVWNPTRMMQKQQMQQVWLKQQSLLQKAFATSSQTFFPPYEITKKDSEVQISLDVPGIKSEDIHVNLEEDGSVLSIRGSRTTNKAEGFNDEARSFQSKFSQSFYVDPTVDVQKVTANLQNGVLVISAPYLKSVKGENVRSIPVTVASSEDNITNLEASKGETTGDEQDTTNMADVEEPSSSTDLDEKVAHQT